MARDRFDVAIVGGGHNALVSAVLLAREGLRVVVLEKRDHVGGAAISAEVFPGTGARLSEYAYLLSMFPDELMEKLGLRVEARPRRIASCTPRANARDTSDVLLVDNTSASRTARSFRAFTGNERDRRGFDDFYARCREAAEIMAPTVLRPLMSRDEMAAAFRRAGAAAAWRMLVERPIEEAIESRMRDDDVRGLVYTDACIGILPDPRDKTLAQNRTLLYHVIGNGEGAWKVPVGGMGKIASELLKIATRLGVDVRTDAEVTKVRVGEPHRVTYRDARRRARAVEATYVLAGVAPAVFARMLGKARPARKPQEGSVFKINMLVDELPDIKGGVSGRDAFCGTFHVNEGYRSLRRTARAAARGEIMPRPPSEVYCHTLTDRSILPRGSKRNSLTMFGLSAPHGAFGGKANAALRAPTAERYLATLDRYLETPLAECLARDADGELCVSAKTPVDIERELGMPRGNIFHGRLTWPFADTRAERGTWGVETRMARVFVCGSGALRGGCVSGIPGHNAAMRVLQAEAEA